MTSLPIAYFRLKGVFQGPVRLVCLWLLCFSTTAACADLSKLRPVLSDLKCLDCHSADEKRGGLDLENLSRNLNDTAVEAEWEYIYDRVRRNEMPPKKEPQPDAERRASFLSSLGEILSQHDTERRSKSGRVVMRRLNRVEYENTVHDLLAIDAPLSDLLPVDSEAYGFDNVGEALRLSSVQIEAYLAAANFALDSAIRLGPGPESVKRHFNYLEMSQIKVLLTRVHGTVDRAGNKYRQVCLARPEAFVIFVDDSKGLTALRGTQAPIAGMYRVRLSASAYQSPDQPVVAKIFASRLTSKRQVASFKLPSNQSQEMEATVRLEKGELIDLGAAGCGIAKDGSRVEEVGAEKFKGSGVAIQWVEVEGPLAYRWPPRSVAMIFDDARVRSLETPRDGRAFGLISPEPAAESARLLLHFAQRAFRRPVAEADIGRYLALTQRALAEGAGFEEAVRRGCLAILTSPEFLFLREGPGRLDDYALASRLSYFLWSTMPDDELLQSASKGLLHDPQVLWDQTERMLNSPRAEAFSHNFCGQWLNLRSIDATTPDKLLYPEFDYPLQQAMVGETERFFAELFHSDLGVSALINSDFTMLNQRLAEHYHLPGVEGDEFRKVSLPIGSHRGGILTHASILKVTANGTWTSPVTRGAWVMQRLLGRPSKPPPANVGSIEPDTRGATTIREQLDKHRHTASCAACHQYIDPPGFALERYDVIGGWRDWYRSQENGQPVLNPLTGKSFNYHQGPPVDAKGELVDGRKFDGPEEFKKLLLDQQEEVARNLVTQLMTYATGAGVTFADRAAVEEILEHARSKAYGVRTLIHEIVQSPLFQTK